MTKIALGHDEWWPVPEIDRHSDYEGEELVDLPDEVIERFERATAEFHAAWSAIATAAAIAGHTYWAPDWLPDERDADS